MKIKKLLAPELRSLDRNIWRLVIPSLLECLLTYAVGLITAAMIGRLHADDIAAQSMGMRITGLVQALFRGIGVGATVVVGMKYGARKLGQCRRIIEMTMVAVLLMSVVCVAVVRVFPVFFLKLFSSDAELINTARPYLNVAIWLCPSAGLSRIVTAAFNGQGDTKTPLIIAVLTNIINAALCYALVFGFGSIPAMGLRGAAWGLVISNHCGIFIGLLTLYSKNGLYRGVTYDKRLSREDFQDLKRIFSTGLPASGENMMWTFAAMVMGRVLLSYGSTVYASYQLASQVEEFFAAPAFGFQIAATTLAAQCAGNGDQEKLRGYYRRICVLSTLVSIPIMLVMLIFPRFFMVLLTNKADIQQIGSYYLIIASFAYIPQMLNMVAFGAVRAMGYKGIPIAGTVIGMWCIRVPIAALSAWAFKADIVVVFAAIAFDQFVRLAFVWTFIRRKKLMKPECPSQAGAPKLTGGTNQ